MSEELKDKVNKEVITSQNEASKDTSKENKKQKKVKKAKTKKPLSNFILFPIVLGSVCLISAGAIAGINYLTEPIIARNAEKKFLKSCYKLLGDENIDKTQGTDGLSKADFPTNASYVLRAYKVFVTSEFASSHSEYSDFYYYVLQTPSGFSGSVTLACIIAGTYGEDGVLYDMMAIDTTSEDALGADQLQNMTVKPGYAGEDGDNLLNSGYITSGATAAITFNAVDTAVKQAIQVFEGKIIPTIGYQKTEDGYEIYYNEHSIENMTYSSFTGYVYIKDEKVYNVEILSSSNTIGEQDNAWLNGGSYSYYEGMDLVDFTSFSNKYVNATDGVSFEVFLSDPVYVTGATEATKGYVEFIKSTIELYNEHHNK